VLDTIGKCENIAPSFGIIDVSMHRDDIGRAKTHTVKVSQLPLDSRAAPSSWWTDVLFRTHLRAAMDAGMSFGLPPHPPRRFD